MKKEVKSAIKTVVETLWEFESGWGMDLKSIEAARLLQSELGYKTDWDAARLRSQKRAQQSKNKIRRSGQRI